jgi:hypothetical protein
MISTEEEIQNDESDEQSENVEPSRRESFEPGSNVTLDRHTQSEKHVDPSVAREDGTESDESDEQQENAEASILER